MNESQQFLSYLEFANREVNSWPNWKQTLLGGTKMEMRGRWKWHLEGGPDDSYPVLRNSKGQFILKTEGGVYPTHSGFILNRYDRLIELVPELLNVIEIFDAYRKQDKLECPFCSGLSEHTSQCVIHEINNILNSKPGAI